jgi:hypothetical protein
MNQGLDGSLYVSTNIGPGFLRNPLFAFPLAGKTLTEPWVIHDEKGLRDPKGREVPFADHGVGGNFFLEGRWRHLLLYRLCDLRETNGEGRAPLESTGLYLAELEYQRVTVAPFRF